MNKPINDGGPAFPRLGEGFGDKRYEAKGMSLRDYFAAKVMEGDFANPSSGFMSHKATDENLLDSAKFFYRMADAMLAARRLNK